MSSVPRTRDCRFSSARPKASFPAAAKTGRSAPLSAWTPGSMGMTSNGTPRLAASARASVIEPSDENLDGRPTPRTWAGPRAAAARTPVTAESMPPESPSTTLEKPVLRQ